MKVSEAILIIAVTALCTQLTRAIPFLLFGGKKEVPGFVTYLGGILPPAIMVILVLYCVRNTVWTAFPFGLPELLGILAVALLHIWKRNNLLSIGGGPVLYMILVQFVFR